MARAPQRPPYPPKGKRAADFDPFADFDPRIGPLPESDEAPALDKPAKRETVADFLTAELQTTQERMLVQFRKMRDRLRTPDGKIRRAKLIGAVIGLHLEGFKRPEIAAILGVTPMVVTKAMRRARENATVADLLKKLDEETLPIAVDNVHQAVADGDLRMSQKVLEGRGIYRTHKSIDAQVTNTKVEIKLVTMLPASLAPGALLPLPKAGAIQAGPPAISVVPVKVEDAEPAEKARTA